MKAAAEHRNICAAVLFLTLPEGLSSCSSSEVSWWRVHYLCRTCLFEALSSPLIGFPASPSLSLTDVLSISLMSWPLTPLQSKNKPDRLNKHLRCRSGSNTSHSVKVDGGNPESLDHRGVFNRKLRGWKRSGNTINHQTCSSHVLRCLISELHRTNSEHKPATSR